MEIKFVEPRLTILSKDEAYKALHDAWVRKFGSVTDKQASIITAQWATETGWGQSMYNYNFGGIKGADPKTGMIAAYATKEGHGETEKHITDNFRAYETAVDGAEDYIDLLYRKYPKAVECIKKEDPTGFVNEIKGVYFTGNPVNYLKNIKSISRHLADWGDNQVVAKPAPVAKKQVAKKQNVGSKPRQQVKKVTPKENQKKSVKKKSDYILELSKIFLKKAAE